MTSFSAISYGRLKTWKNGRKPPCLLPGWWCITHVVFYLCWCSIV